jgi:DNA-binding NarL/FixJ family response regulator
MAEPIRVLIADDTDIAREGLSRILSTQADMRVVGEGATIHETIQKTLELQPDVLILDLNWFSNEQAGIEAIRRLKQESPSTKIIALTVYPHLIEQARQAGAASSLGKEVPKQQLIDEIRSVYALPKAPEVHSPADEERPVPAAEQLSDREREVLQLMAEGKMDKEIAQALSIAESTAKNHVANILGKLGVANRAAAVSWGYQHGMIKGRKS